MFSLGRHAQTDLVWREEVLEAGPTKWHMGSATVEKWCTAWTRRQTVELDVWGREERQEGGVKGCTHQTPTAASQSWCYQAARSSPVFEGLLNDLNRIGETVIKDKVVTSKTMPTFTFMGSPIASAKPFGISLTKLWLTAGAYLVFTPNIWH